MTRAAGLAGLLLLLAACHRSQTELAPDADAEARAATAAKTLADITAAEEASRPPLPTPAPRPRANAPIAEETAPPPDSAPGIAPDNAGDAAPPP